MNSLELATEMVKTKGVSFRSFERSKCRIVAMDLLNTRASEGTLREELTRLRKVVGDAPHAPSCPQDAEREPCEESCPGCIHDGASMRFGPRIPHRRVPRRPCDCWKSKLDGR